MMHVFDPSTGEVLTENQLGVLLEKFCVGVGHTYSKCTKWCSHSKTIVYNQPLHCNSCGGLDPETWKEIVEGEGWWVLQAKVGEDWLVWDSLSHAAEFLKYSEAAKMLEKCTSSSGASFRLSWIPKPKEGGQVMPQPEEKYWVAFIKVGEDDGWCPAHGCGKKANMHVFQSKKGAVASAAGFGSEGKVVPLSQAIEEGLELASGVELPVDYEGPKPLSVEEVVVGKTVAKKGPSGQWKVWVIERGNKDYGWVPCHPENCIFPLPQKAEAELEMAELKNAHSNTDYRLRLVTIGKKKS